MSTERLPRLRHILLALALFLCASLLTGTGAKSKQEAAAGRMGEVVDWSRRHILYPQGASLRALALSQHDPRAYWNYLKIVRAANTARAQEAEAAQARDDDAGQARSRDRIGEDAANRPVDTLPGRVLRKGPKRAHQAHVDWSLPLGLAGMAADMFPAKYSFDVNATPDCTNDYLVFTIDTVPSVTQANIVAYNNLYSGSAGGTGICGAGTATPYWAYQVSNVALPTSPIISLDGTKVAFVDGANPAVFHVLTWTAGGTVTAPATPTVIANVTLTGATTDTLSSPFMDYNNDIAYVGSDNGRLFKITGVFRGVPTLAGKPWPRKVGTGIITSPVIDFSTGEIFAGSSDGNLYGFTKGGAEFFPISIGDGTADGGIVDGPIVDVVNGLLYVATGSDFTVANASLSQVNTASFTQVQDTPIGTSGVANIHDGAFNDAYFSSGTSSQWFFYVCGTNTGGPTSPVLYRVGFDGTRLMNAATDATTVTLSANNGEQCSPLTELKNGVDRIFLGLLTSAQVEFFDVSTNPGPTLGGTGAVAPVAEAGGTSGIIVDNVSASNQASSIYFSTLANSANCAVAGVNMHCAVKLTQGGLQ